MLEALREQATASPFDYLDPQVELPAIVPPIEVNDNDVSAQPREGERKMFELPANIWIAMVGCYGIFLAALLAATGGASATFAIAISAVYVVMFFGTARALLRQAPPQPRSPLERSGAVLSTAFGPVGHGEVLAQVLIVPAAVAFFGIAIAIISAFVM